MRTLRFVACDLGLAGGGPPTGDNWGLGTVSAVGGARLERILGGRALVWGSVLKSMADAGLGGPAAPTEAARGGPTTEGGGGALEALIPGEAVWARGGGGVGCAVIAAASPPA